MRIGRAADAGGVVVTVAVALLSGCPWPVMILTIVVAIADAVEGFDLGEGLIDGLELLADTLDVAVDGAVVDIDIVVVGGVH